MYLIAIFPALSVAVFAVFPQCDMPGFYPQSTVMAAFIFKWRKAFVTQANNIAHLGYVCSFLHCSLQGLRTYFGVSDLPLSPN